MIVSFLPALPFLSSLPLFYFCDYVQLCLWRRGEEIPLRIQLTKWIVKANMLCEKQELGLNKGSQNEWETMIGPWAAEKLRLFLTSFKEMRIGCNYRESPARFAEQLHKLKNERQEVAMVGKSAKRNYFESNNTCPWNNNLVLDPELGADCYELK